MKTRLPIVWGTLLFLVGLIIGQQWPSMLFLPATLVALIAKSFLWKHPRTAAFVGIAFWLLLGCSRMSLHRLLDSEPIGRTEQALRNKAQQITTMLVQRMEREGFKDKDARALGTAMLLGDRSELSREIRQTYSETGTAHLLALSGLHLGVLYGLFYILFLYWARYTQWRWHALPIMLLCIWGYAFLTGFPVSLIRASIMLSLLTIGSLAERNVPAIHSLSLAALIILLCWPEAISDIGFMLSFASVFFIIMLYLPLQHHYYKLFSGWGTLLKPLGISLAAQIGTAPLCLYFFHTLPLAAALINLLLIPFTSCIVYLGFAAVLFPFPLLVSALTKVLSAELRLVEWWSSLPNITLHDIYITPWMVVLMYALLLVGIVRIHQHISEDRFV